MLRDPLSVFCSPPTAAVRNTNGAARRPSEDRPAFRPEAVTFRLSEIEEQPLEWLWPGRFPLGMLSVISGDPNVGKSSVAIDIASRVTRGTPWPDARNDPNPIGDALFLVGEDSLSKTVVPRVRAAGGDLNRIIILDGVRQSVDRVDQINLDSDLRILDDVLGANEDTRLVVIDTLDGFFGETDTHRKSEVQRVLNQLGQVADRHNVAVIGLLHLRKQSGDKALYRTLGSLGFVSAPRSVWAVTRDREDKSKRLMTCVKLNIAPDPTGLSFTIPAAGVIHWGADAVDLTADEAMEREAPQARTAKDDASDWLLATLAIGPMNSDKLRDLAREEDISWSTLRRAKDALGVRARKRMDGWAWELQGAQGVPDTK